MVAAPPVTMTMEVPCFIRLLFHKPGRCESRKSRHASARMQGGPREVEIGAFLSEEERISLERELTEALAAFR